MVIGVVVGTYSSVFIASPILLWLESRKLPNQPGRSAESSKSKKLAAG
jgi:preprotein translocase subunit SecF